MKRMAGMFAGAAVAIALAQAVGCGLACTTRSELKSGTFRVSGDDRYRVVLDPAFATLTEEFDLDGKHWQRSYRVVSFTHHDEHR